MQYGAAYVPPSSSGLPLTKLRYADESCNGGAESVHISSELFRIAILLSHRKTRERECRIENVKPGYRRNVVVIQSRVEWPDRQPVMVLITSAIIILQGPP